ncbi:MAG TPA: HAD family hydrolase [Nitrososphaerales archaeon]
MLSAAIFDLDGTLVDFHFDGVSAKRALLTRIAELGVDAKVSEADPTQTIFDKVYAKLSSNGASSKIEAVRKELYRILDYYELQASPKILLKENALETLETLKDDVALALVTNSGRKPADQILRKHRIEKFFKVTVTRDDMTRLKPRGDGIAMAVSMLNVDVSEAIYIGDSVYDIRAAREANVMVAAVVGGVHNTERLIKEEPDIVINDIAVVPSMLKRLRQINSPADAKRRNGVSG